MKLIIYIFTLCLIANQSSISSSTDTSYYAYTSITDSTIAEIDSAIVEVDSMAPYFEIYQQRADLYLSRPAFSGTPITGEILATCAKNAYDSTGIILPVELALSQAQWESGMGKKGKSPICNPYNVGEWNTSGVTVCYFKSTEEGVQAYYDVMCSNYLPCYTVEQLLNNFVNCGNHRYAHSTEYEDHVRNQYYFNIRWIDKHFPTDSLLTSATR